MMPGRRAAFFSGVLVLLAMAASCAHRPVTQPEEALEAAAWPSGMALDDEGMSGIAEAVRRSLEYYQKAAPDTVFQFGPERATALDMIITLRNFLLIAENGSLTKEQKEEQIKGSFSLFRSPGSDGSGRVLFTGYYEPKLTCRTVKDDVFRHPLYRRPGDIIEADLALFGDSLPKTKLLGRVESGRFLPYHTREEIDGKNALAGRGLEALWCNDPVDIYFLQVQGSGKAEIGKGEIVSVLYDGQNGRPYRSIGKYLIDEGVMTKEAMSLQALRDYLRSKPERLSDVLYRNPSYVFFRIDQGPSLGNIGVPLTPGRSIATDSRLFPKGALALITTQKPVVRDGAIVEWKPFTRIVVNQDTGGAIRGAGRVDLFWGPGPEAELAAGHLQHEGRLYFLLRKK